MQHAAFWQFLAGVAFFLFGMSQLETVLKNASGRSLKLFLKRNTGNLFKSIIGGAFVTALVQSSSVVALIILVFVEAGIITFRNALGVILGTNLGTTISSWLVATVGFKVDVLDYTFPVIAITGIGMFFFASRKNIYNLFAVFFALGMLFMGISYMKESAMELVKLVDPAAYAGYGTIVFVLFGFVLTTIIQSSSATVAITLTALYAGALQFDAAAAVVIGSEIGTTIKILLWGVTGSADKKRVAYGNFFYNIFTSVLAFVCLRWLIYFITTVVGIKDPLIGLVFFQTTINTLSIIIFVPFLNIFTGWLERRFTANASDDNSYISHNLPVLPVLAPDALRHEVVTLLSKALNYCTDILNTHTVHTKGLLQNIKSFAHTTQNIEVEYHKLKQTEGDILSYFSSLQNNQTLSADTEHMLRYLHAARQAIYAAKAVKDIAHNLAEFDASANDVLHHQVNVLAADWNAFVPVITPYFTSTELLLLPDDHDTAMIAAHEQEGKFKVQAMLYLKEGQLNEIEVSTLMNVYREIYASKKSLLAATTNLS